MENTVETKSKSILQEEARKARNRHNAKWAKENYELLCVRVPKGFNAQIAETLKKNGMTKRQFVIKSLENNFVK